MTCYQSIKSAVKYFIDITVGYITIKTGFFKLFIRYADSRQLDNNFTTQSLNKDRKMLTQTVR